MEKQTIVQKAFIKIMEERVFQVAREKSKLDDVYIESAKKRSITLELLRESLTSDRQRYLLCELEDTWSFLEGLEQEYAYRQGLEDSSMIHKELNAFGINVTNESIKATF